MVGQLERLNGQKVGKAEWVKSQTGWAVGIVGQSESQNGWTVGQL
jgi:hypothetical protein